MDIHTDICGYTDIYRQTNICGYSDIHGYTDIYVYKISLDIQIYMGINTDIYGYAATYIYRLTDIYGYADITTSTWRMRFYTAILWVRNGLLTSGTHFAMSKVKTCMQCSGSTQTRLWV